MQSCNSVQKSAFGILFVGTMSLRATGTRIASYAVKCSSSAKAGIIVDHFYCDNSLTGGAVASNAGVIRCRNVSRPYASSAILLLWAGGRK